jgi:hypothetical protein
MQKRILLVKISSFSKGREVSSWEGVKKHASVEVRQALLSAFDFEKDNHHLV